MKSDEKKDFLPAVVGMSNNLQTRRLKDFKRQILD